MSIFERGMRRYILDFRVPASTVPTTAVSAADR